MSKAIRTKGAVKARKASTMNGCRPKVEFHAENQRIASYPRIQRDNVFDVNNIVRFKDK